VGTSQEVGDDRTPVLYVAGVPRSGSTLTDIMIGQLPGHVGAGELYYMWHNGPRRDVTCACGESFAACPFWSRVGELAFGGWDRAPVDEVLRLQMAVDRTSRIPLILAGRLLPRFHQQVDRYLSILEDLYAAMADAGGGRVVVDSSKRPSLAFVLRRSRRADVRVVHVVRDPRGVANSWRKTVPLPAGASHRQQMPTWSTTTVIRRWITVNAMVAALARLGTPRLVVRYEDLVCDPQGSLRRIGALHDTAVGPGQLDFVTDGGLRPGCSHTIAGSRIRLRSGVVPLRVDDAWRRELPAPQRRAVGLGTWLSRRRYGYP